MDGVAALEGHHVLVLGDRGAHLGGGAAGEHSLRQLQTLERAAQVEAAALRGDHLDGRVLQGSGAVAAEGLTGFVGLPAALDREHRQLLPLVGEQKAITEGDRGVVGVEDDRQTEQQAGAGAVLGHHGLVVLLMHEAP